METIADLQARSPGVGRIELILLRPERRGDLVSVDVATAVEGRGLDGDHRASKTPSQRPSPRQVTLIMGEHLDAVGALLATTIDPRDTRRNLVVRGINLNACKDRDVQIGDVTVHITGPAHPCSRMEENLGPGGYQSMRGHGGMTATILTSGQIHVGDNITATNLQA